PRGPIDVKIGVPSMTRQGPACAYVSGEMNTRFQIFFFFSSRRRHTRWPRDWSSDVCSSDLEGHKPGTQRKQGPGTHGNKRRCTRSEERRVGKECRCRWAPAHSKKKTGR